MVTRYLQGPKYSKVYQPYCHMLRCPCQKDSALCAMFPCALVPALCSQYW